MRRFITALLVLVIFVTPAFAETWKLPNANAFLAKATEDTSAIEAINSSEIGSALSAILLLIYKVGYGVAVIVLFYIAIQMMIAPAQKKSEVKAALTPYALGLLLLVAGVPIATMIIRMFMGIF